MLIVDNASVVLGNNKVLDQISFSLLPGSLNVIIGPNGCGKSTLVKTIFGCNKISSGRVIWNPEKENSVGLLGKNFALKSWQENIAYMPQGHHINSSLSVMEVVILGEIKSLGLKVSDNIVLQAIRCLDSIGMEHLASCKVKNLSGGQQQMVLFAQLLMRESPIALLDEPVSALDIYHQLSLMDTLKINTKKNKWVSVVVLHDINLACQYADNLIVLSKGKLIEAGQPDKVVSKEMLSDIYGVNVDMFYDDNQRPVVRPSSRTLVSQAL